MPFPLALPFPTAFYLTLYVLTFVLHQAFMHYVLAGSLYVAWTMVFPGQPVNPGDPPRSEQPLALILRDWMPFLLSAAITAGVAPLLFIQIVYQRQFYSANLLLFWRWMLVVPVLIIAFYLLYLIKSRIMDPWSRTLRASVAVLTAGCFVFVGFCWTVNYLIGTHQANWPEIYVTGRFPFGVSTILFRMLVWIGGSFSTMAAIVAWQLLSLQSRREKSTPLANMNEAIPNPITASGVAALDQAGRQLAPEIRRLAAMSLSGLLVAVLAGIITLIQSDAATRNAVLGLRALPYLLVTGIGVAAQVVGWRSQLKLPQIQRMWLILISGGATVALLGISFVREAVRVEIIDLTSQYSKHAEAAKIGGFAVFLFFTVAVTLTIVWCLSIVRQGLAETEGSP